MPKKSRKRRYSGSYAVARNLYLQKTYGITSKDYEAMKLKQGGCGICGKILKRKKYCVDHDHGTGLVRGLLCQRCNRGLGYFSDSLEGIQRAYAYLLQAYKPGTKIIEHD